MAGVLNRIKEKVRSRSDSTGSSEAPDSTDYTHSSGVGRTSDVASSPRHHATPPRTSLENSAFHVSRAGGVRTSVDSPSRSAQAHPTNAYGSSSHNRGPSQDAEPSRFAEATPLASSSRHGPPPTAGHIRKVSPEDQRSTGEEIVPDRSSSGQAVQSSATSDRHVRRKSLPNNNPTSPDTGHSTTMSNSTGFAGQTAEKNLPVIPESRPSPIGQAVTTKGMNSERSPRSDSLQPKPSARTITNHNSGRDGMETPGRSELAASAQLATQYLDHKDTAMSSDSYRLPEGFSLENSVKTHVTEDHRPAVTHERFVRQRTEIIQEAITRDIHVHHYYTYLQPINVVEVRPARHFMLDSETGSKIEIDAPAGWQMPASMTPTIPDTTEVSGWTRHYLVDEGHPRGVPEAPPLEQDMDTAEALPLKHEQGHGDLRAKAVTRHV